MQSLFRRTTRLARPSFFPASSFLTHTNQVSVRRYTSQSYSIDDKSGQTEADASKLKANVERPSLKDTISSLSSSSSSESKTKGVSTSSHVETSHGGSPAIEDWRSAHEKVQKLLDQIWGSDDPGVRLLYLSTPSRNSYYLINYGFVYCARQTGSGVSSGILVDIPIFRFISLPAGVSLTTGKMSRMATFSKKHC